MIISCEIANYNTPSCRFMLRSILSSLFVILFFLDRVNYSIKVPLYVDHTATYDIVLLIVFQSVRIILQTTFLNVLTLLIFSLKTQSLSFFILAMKVFTCMVHVHFSALKISFGTLYEFGT